jgi:hypothetical protein
MRLRNMAHIADPLEILILINLILYTKVICHHTTKHVICSRIVANKGANIFYDSVIFKDRAKSFLLIQATMATYCTKSN